MATDHIVQQGEHLSQIAEKYRFRDHKIIWDHPRNFNLKSTNMLERLNEEIKRRTLVVRIFPDTNSCLRLIRALAVEMHENWIEAARYLNMDFLKEHRKQSAHRVPAA